MTIKRTLFDFWTRTWETSTTVKTQAGNGLLSGEAGIFWPLTADGTFGASISTKVVGYEYIFTDGSTNQLTTINGTPETGITVTVVGDDKENSKRIIKVTNTGSVGIVQINVVQEDLPWYYNQKSDFERFEMAFSQIAALEARVAALEAAAP